MVSVFDSVKTCIERIAPHETEIRLAATNSSSKTLDVFQKIHSCDQR